MTRNLFLLITSLCTTIFLHAQSYTPTTTLMSEVKPTTDSINASAPIEVQLSTIKEYMGKYVKVCGKIYSVKLLKNVANTPTLMNMGSAKANERVEVRIQFENVDKLGSSPEDLFLNKDLCITGRLTNEHGYAEINLTPQQQQDLIRSAELTKKASKPKPVQQPLATNAYLFAGPSLKEPIISHLKQGSIVVPLYTFRKWIYVSVIEKKGSSTPVALMGFIRAQSMKTQSRKKDAELSLAAN